MKYLFAFAAICIGCATAGVVSKEDIQNWFTEKDCPEITDVKTDFDMKLVG
jgi:hypothetical protein